MDDFYFEHVQSNRMSPNELMSLLTHIGHMYPVQFIIDMDYIYDPAMNESRVWIRTDKERFKGQFNHD